LGSSNHAQPIGQAGRATARLLPQTLGNTFSRITKLGQKMTFIGLNLSEWASFATIAGGNCNFRGSCSGVDHA